MAEESITRETGEGAATAPDQPEGTQPQPDEQLGDGGKKALQEERRKARAAERQLGELQKRLQELEDRDKTEAQKLTDRATAAETDATQAKRELERYRVARDKKIPAEWVDRLKGSTKEELEADAEALLEALGTQQQRNTPSYDGGVRAGAPPATDMNALIRQAAGRG